MTRNPTLNTDTFRSLPVEAGAGTMTVQGAVNKTMLLLAILVATGSFTWQAGEAGPGLMIVGFIVGTIFALITCFKRTWAPVTAPIYAAAEGLLLGGISVSFNRAYPGIAVQAVMLTLATLAAMLGAYTMGFIRATESFKRGVFAATAGIALFYFIAMILSFFHVGVPIMYGNGWFSIGLSFFVVIIAALNLVVDFDVIEQGAAAGAPKYMEWYSAFGLMVTLVWLYLEILRLLVKLNSRRD